MNWKRGMLWVVVILVAMLCGADLAEMRVREPEIKEVRIPFDMTKKTLEGFANTFKLTLVDKEVQRKYEQKIEDLHRAKKIEIDDIYRRNKYELEDRRRAGMYETWTQGYLEGYRQAMKAR